MSQSIETKEATIEQTLTPEQASLEQQPTQATDQDLAVNFGDIIDESQSIQEKAQQIAVNTADIIGDHEVVPTYFVVDQPSGEQEALHHVKDAEEISDVIRQARVDEGGGRTWR